ncbi:LysR substrate-binding domain-containing protein [Micrococcus luteus]|uniref:LysR substrate-binding domain-containing protein n=1 Tax=Micrococcus luteus TaxID=1270 RepID=UPI00387996A7
MAVTPCLCSRNGSAGTLSSSNTVARRTRSGRCATGAIDAALIRSSPPKRAIGPGLERLPLFTERLVVSVTSSDSRARQESVTLADLADGPVAVCATAPTATGELWSTTAHMPRTISVANTGEWLTRIAVGEGVSDGLCKPYREER